MKSYFDKNGVLLAEVPDVGYAVPRKTESRIGNKLHDARSGKFAPGWGKRPTTESALPNVDPIEMKRMFDAVRDAAREFDFLEEGDVREFLQGRAKNPAQVDIQGFMQLYREQIKTDLCDILDQQLRRDGSLKRGRRHVRVQAPRGYVRRTLNGLSEEEIGEMMHRLEARGHEREALDKFFDSRMQEDKAGTAKEKREAIAASDDWVPSERVLGEVVDDDHDAEMFEFAAEVAERVARGIQPPVVHVQPNINVNVPEQKPMKRVILRDEKGLAIGAEDVPADAS